MQARMQVVCGMRISTVSGLILGGLVLISALLLGGVPLESMIRPEALLIVFGGIWLRDRAKGGYKPEKI